MASCMLQSKGLALNFWAEAINYANYIVNRTPTKELKNITPEEAWSSIKPDVSHFHVFGSEAWAHIPDEKHKALEPIGVPMFWQIWQYQKMRQHQNTLGP